MEAEVVFCFLFLAKCTVPQCHSEGAISVFVTLGPSAPLLSPSAVPNVPVFSLSATLISPLRTKK